jgi:hypothetical protein
MVTRDDLWEIEDQAREAMENFDPYERDGVRLTRLRTPGAHTYRVEWGDGVFFDHWGLRAAISNLLYRIIVIHRAHDS